MRSRCIEPALGPVDADLDAPPSKSWTHRALVAAALADGVSRLDGPLDADDTRRTRAGLVALGVTIVPDEAVACDRSLDSTRFRRDFGYEPPSWDAMLDELAAIVKGAA